MKAQDLFDLSGEVALVTGASSGLGESMARTLAENGAQLVAVARRKDRLEKLVAEIEQAGGKAIAVEADVGDRASMEAAFDAAERAFGTVTVLVNNAGIARPGSALSQSMDDWRAVMAINLDAVFSVAQIAAQRMAKAKVHGSIVNISSLTAWRVEKGLASYAVAKAGVKHLTEALALEWGSRGIRVNAIAPGYISTEMNSDYLAGEAGQKMVKAMPLGRLGQASDLDGELLLLASKAGRWITGTTRLVDGGHYLVGSA